MVTFGGYETVYELHRHGLGSVSRARAANGNAGAPDYVVKVFHPPHRITGHDALKPAIASFLERARLQQDVATGGARYWAPVYEAGATRPGAYYVSRYYARSAQKLIASRVKLSAQALHTLIHAVVQGLLELEQACQRPHGNLTPSNVLIGGEGDLEQAPIALTDPAPPDELARNGGSFDDLVGVGELIFQLVLHRPFRGLQSWPVPRSAEWTRLGSKGEAWRELCNQLLDPNAPQPPPLEAVAARVAALRPRRWAITPKRVGVVVLLAVLVAGAVFAVQYSQFKGEWREFCLITNEWFSGFHRQLNELRKDPARLHRLGQDPHLAKSLEPILADGIELDPKRIAHNDLLVYSKLADQAPLSWPAMKKTHRALATIRTVQNDLAPSRWPMLRELADRRKDYQERGWESPARYLGKIVDDATPGHSADLLAGIDNLLASQANLRGELAAIESQWQKVAATRALIAQNAAGDKVLAQFDPFVQRYLASTLPAGQDLKDLAELRAPLVTLGDLATQLKEVLDSDWTTKVDRDRFAREGKVYSDAGGQGDTRLFQRWIGEVSEYYRYKPEAGTEAVAGLETLTADVRKEIQALRRDVPTAVTEANGFDARLAVLENDISEFHNRAWVKKDRTSNAVTERATAVQTGLKSLKDEVRREWSHRMVNQPKWWDEVNSQRVADSAVVSDHWKRWLAKLPVDAARLPMDPKQFDDIKARVDERRTLLVDLDKSFPPAPSLDAPHDAVARRKREEMLDAVLRSSAWQSEQTRTAALGQEQASQANAYREWSNDAQAFLKQVADARRLLDETYTLADAPGLGRITAQWKARPVWKDFSTDPAIAATLTRLADLEAVAAMPRPTLAASASADKGRPEIVLAAWRQLSRQDNPKWPATADELKAEAGIRARLKNQFAAVRDAILKQRLAKEVQDAGPPTLARFLNATGTSKDLVEPAVDAAGGAADAFDLPPGRAGSALPLTRVARLEGLTPEVRYNVLLRGLRRAADDLKGNDANAVARLSNEFREELKLLPSDLRQRPEPVGLLAGLDRVDDAEPPAGPPATWRRDAAQAGRLRFAIPGLADEAGALEFVLVQPASGRPFYLATTELSFVQFRALIPAAEWAQGRRPVLWKNRLGDDRPGPRVWRWPAAGDFNPSVEPTDYWLRYLEAQAQLRLVQHAVPETQFNRQSLHSSFGGDPLSSKKLPMQYLPAPTALYVAAQAGCRLPTSGEWRAAAELAHAPRDAQANRRDERWELQRAHVAANGRGQLEWPDAGAFWPKDYKGPRKSGEGAESLRWRDGVLWFRDVDAAPGNQLFPNLVGNVAEYVWDDPRAFDQLQEKSIDGMHQLLGRSPDKLFVIGGSAISAPELEVDRALPVDLAQANNPPSAWHGFADVGMRLAFSAPSTPAQRLVVMLGEQPYLLRK